MITTVTLNPCIDLTLEVPGLDLGSLNLAGAARTDLAGKGINVSVVLRALGMSTLCTGINYHGNGRLLEDHLERHSICHRFAVARGEIRTNVKLYDGGRLTELNHPGTPVEPYVVGEYLRILEEWAGRSSMVVFSGRLPAGEPQDLYRRSIRALAGLPVRVAVDAEGPPLLEAVKEKPYLIKPNLQEMETTFGRVVRSPKEAAAACRDIVEAGVSVVCLSMGEKGAVIADRETVWYAPPLPIEVRGIQGAGDSMMAGLCKGIRMGAGLGDCLRYGMAAAAGSLEREGTLLCRREDFHRMLPLAKVEPMDLPALPPLPSERKAAKAKPKKKTGRNPKQHE